MPTTSSEPSPDRSSPAVAFVLPGGGSTGAVHIGVLRALLDAGIFPDVLVGCSVGALNAAWWASEPTTDQLSRMESFWARLSGSDVFGRGWYRVAARIALHRDHLWSALPLRGLIERTCPVQDLADLMLPVHVATTDLDHGITRWWTAGPLADILYASACLPGLLPPAVLDGVRHVDGGVLEPVPVARAVDLDAKRIFVLGEPPDASEVPATDRSPLDVLLRCFWISRYSRIGNPASLARFGQEVIVVPGARTTGISITDFSRTRTLMAESYEISSRFLAEMRGPPKSISRLASI